MSRDRAQERAELDMVRQDVELLLTLVPGHVKRGSMYWAPCPIHQGTALKFGILRGRDGAWRWRCHSACAGAMGDVVDLMVALGSSFKGALKALGVATDRPPETDDERDARQAERLMAMERPLGWWEQPAPEYRGGRRPQMYPVWCDACGVTRLMEGLEWVSMHDPLDMVHLDEWRWAARGGRVRCPACLAKWQDAKRAKAQPEEMRRAA